MPGPGGNTVRTVKSRKSGLFFNTVRRPGEHTPHEIDRRSVSVDELGVIKDPNSNTTSNKQTHQSPGGHIVQRALRVVLGAATSSRRTLRGSNGPSQLSCNPPGLSETPALKYRPSRFTGKQTSAFRHSICINNSSVYLFEHILTHAYIDGLYRDNGW